MGLKFSSAMIVTMVMNVKVAAMFFLQKSRDNIAIAVFSIYLTKPIV